MTIETNKRQVVASADLNFPSVAGNSIEVLTVTVQNVQVGNAVLVTPPATLQVAAIASQGTLTLDTIPADSNTMTVDTKVYTFEDSLTNVDGNIYTGGSLAQAKLNVVAAFDLSGVAGTDYATLMTAHPSVDIATFIVNDSILTAKVGGAAGDTIVTTETFTPAGNIFDDVTLGTTRAGEDARASNLIIDGMVTAEHTVTVRAINPTVTAGDPISGTFQIVVFQ